MSLPDAEINATEPEHFDPVQDAAWAELWSWLLAPIQPSERESLGLPPEPAE